MSATKIKNPKATLFGPFRELEDLPVSTLEPCQDHGQRPRFGFGPVTRLQRMALDALEVEYQQGAVETNQEIEGLKDQAAEQGVPLKVLGLVDGVLTAQEAIKHAKAKGDKEGVERFQVILEKLLTKGGPALEDALGQLTDAGQMPASWTIFLQRSQIIGEQWAATQRRHVLLKASVLVKSLKGDWALHMEELKGAAWPALRIDAMRGAIKDRGDLLMLMEEDAVSELIDYTEQAVREGLAALRADEKKPSAT